MLVRLFSTTMLILATTGCRSSGGGDIGFHGYNLKYEALGEQRKFAKLGATGTSVVCFVGNELLSKQFTQPNLGQRFIQLLLDDTRSAAYEEDSLLASTDKVVFCENLDPCVYPSFEIQAASSLPPLLWTFSLNPDIELTPESQELVDLFLQVYEECRTEGEPYQPPSDEG